MLRDVTEGIGRTRTRVGPEIACGYLADPRHASEWFASVEVDGLDSGALQRGHRWRFVQGRRGAGRPVEMERFDCPRGFAWRTRLPWPRTNVAWELEVAGEARGGSTLKLTTRWLPGMLGWPLVLVLALARRGALAQRSQRTAERARDALEAAYPEGTGPERGPSAGAKPHARRGRRR